ncbi:MAG: cytochrome c [Planctomycetaceae bacterium]|nr:cytochrome c [Planctomycetaceae bacterium]
MKRAHRILSAVAVLAACGASVSAADDREGRKSAPSVNPSLESSAERGYEVLRTRPFLPPDFDDGVFERLWTVWPDELRKEAEAASPTVRRRMTFDRYGLQEPPDVPEDYDGPAMGYVDDGAHGWVMNCFACHAGQVAGQVIPGLPNTDIDLQSLVEDVRTVKLAQFKPFAHLDLGSLKVPLGGTRGTTNSVVFGILLDGFRRPDMSVDLSQRPGRLLHHDMDAPAWWNVSRKSKLYVDGFAPKNHRILMQFMLIPKNDRDVIYGWEDDFRDVLAYIESLDAPQYPGPIDEPLAAKGKIAFVANCASCHGTYGDRDLVSLPSPSGEGPGARGSRPAPLVLASFDRQVSQTVQEAGRPAARPSLLSPLPRERGTGIIAEQDTAARREPRPSIAKDFYPERIIPIAELGTDPVRLEALSVEHRTHLQTTWMTDYGRDETITDPGGYVAPPLDGVWASAPYFHNGSVPTLWHVLRPSERPKLWRRDRRGDGYDHERIGLAVEELKTFPKNALDASARREVFDTSKSGKSAAGHDYPDALSEDEKRAVLEYLKTL